MSDTPEALVKKFNTILCQHESLWGADPSERSLPTRFEGVIRRAHEKTGLRAVILVDEYGKPMLQAIGNIELQDAYRATFKGFYDAFKSMDEHIQFAMLTEYCYVMGFKLDGAAEEALEQIEDRNYTLPFQLDGQQVVRIGLNFSKEHRNIERYVIA